jgi:hypothetical protein
MLGKIIRLMALDAIAEPRERRDAYFEYLNKGWIPARPEEVAARRFSFVHVDFDLYQPTREQPLVHLPTGQGFIVKRASTRGRA